MQEMQEQMNSMNDSEEFQEVESNHFGRLSYAASYKCHSKTRQVAEMARHRPAPFDRVCGIRACRYLQKETPAARHIFTCTVIAQYRRHVGSSLSWVSKTGQSSTRHVSPCASQHTEHQHKFSHIYISCVTVDLLSTHPLPTAKIHGRMALPRNTNPPHSLVSEQTCSISHHLDRSL